MRKQLLISAFSLLSLTASVDAMAGKWTPSTITYKGVTYKLSSSSTCPDGKSALRLYRKWWCPATTTVVTNPTPTPTPTEPAPAPTPVTYTANISWTIPSTRSDGTPLPLSELKGYEIYYTTDNPAVSGTFPVTGASTASYQAPNLAAGNYYFAISAIDVNGLKSSMSTMVPVKFGP